MPNIYFIHYELRPAPHSEDFATTGGAFALCYVQATDAASARIAAERYFEETDWIVVDLESGPVQVERALYEDEPDMLDAYDEALNHGECFLFHLWPPEIGGSGVLH